MIKEFHTHIAGEAHAISVPPNARFKQSCKKCGKSLLEGTLLPEGSSFYPENANIVTLRTEHGGTVNYMAGERNQQPVCSH